MSARFAADRPWHARIPRLASDGIVAAFAIGMTDWMNRRKINYIEPHRFGVVDSGQTIAKSRAAIDASICRTRKKFIPGGHVRRWTIDNHARRWRILRRS